MQDAISNGDADGVFTLPDRADAGGTNPTRRNNILNSQGVSASTQPGSMANIQQAVAERRGVITSHDAGILWNDPSHLGGGHAVLTTGVQYDADGNVQAVVINDTGTGSCRRLIPVDQYRDSLRSGRDINVTNNPIW